MYIVYEGGRGEAERGEREREREKERESSRNNQAYMYIHVQSISWNQPSTDRVSLSMNLMEWSLLALILTLNFLVSFSKQSSAG